MPGSRYSGIPGEERRPSALTFGLDRAGGLLFLATLLFYIGTAPGLIQGTYATENLDSARGLLDHGSLRVPLPWSGGRPVYPRHGFLEAALDAPLVAAARWLRSGDPNAEEWLVSLAPSFFSALLVAVLYCWCGALGAPRRRALAVSATAALGTMLWPYTAIGLEPVLSCSILAAGYSIFMFGRRGQVGWLLAASFWGAMTVAVKMTGLLALPALGLLLLEVWIARPDRRWWAWLMFGVSCAASFWVATATRRDAFVTLLGGSLGPTAAADNWQVLFGVWGQWASPNKGLIFYAPAAILGLIAWPQLNKRAGAVARWVLVLVLVTTAGIGTRYFWADETWGPRYSHGLVAPLMLALAVPASSRWRAPVWPAAWVLAAALGLYVAVVGELFWYGHLLGVMQRAGANELNRILYDPTWNPIAFHSRLLTCRMGGDAYYRPDTRWWFSGPAPEAIRIDYAARFEPLIVYDGAEPRRGGRVVVGARPAHMLAFVGSLVLLGIVTRSTLRGSPSAQVGE